MKIVKCDMCGTETKINEKPTDPGMNKIVVYIKKRSDDTRNEIDYDVCPTCEPLALEAIAHVFPYSEVAE